MNRYLKAFLKTGIPFGIGSGVFYSFQFGLTRGAIVGIVGGLFFGVAMSAILVTWHQRAVKRLAPGASEAEMGVHHTRQVQVQRRYDEAFGLAVSSLQSVGKYKLRKEDKSSGQVEAKVSMSWKSFGEIISFNVRRIDDFRTQIEVSSRPSLGTTFADYGKNLENVEKISNFLNKQTA